MDPVASMTFELLHCSGTSAASSGYVAVIPPETPILGPLAMTNGDRSQRRERSARAIPLRNAAAMCTPINGRAMNGDRYTSSAAARKFNRLTALDLAPAA